MNVVPVYVPSKSRAQYLMTSCTLARAGIEHTLVVEAQQADEYRSAVEQRGLQRYTRVEVLDPWYQRTYEPLDEHGLTRPLGPGPARNYAWDHARALGAAWHWVIDDNVRYFVRNNANKNERIDNDEWKRGIEDFVCRYSNIAMAGPEYEFFVPQVLRVNPIRLNRRVFSCNLIRNDLPFRWRGRYNEDLILSLDMLSVGWCTVVFLAWQQRKVGTQTMRGGNTSEFYARDAITLEKSQLPCRVYPQYVTLTQRFSRIHHRADFSSFTQRLIPIGDSDAA